MSKAIGRNSYSDYTGVLSKKEYYIQKRIEVVELYGKGKSADEIHDLTRISGNTVLRWLKEVNIKPRGSRRYQFNEKFFEFIDNEEKAYWLGFILADGCISYDKKRDTHYTVTLDLQVRDIEHLEKFKRCLNLHVPIRSNGIANCRQLYVNSKKLAESLVRLGITHRKSFIVKPPRVRDDLQRHFWRGVFDGDGTISVLKKEVCIGLTGNDHVCRSFSKFLGFEGKFVYKRGKMTVSCFNINGTSAGRQNLILQQVEKLYKDSKVYLDRKYAKYQELKRKLNVSSSSNYRYSSRELAHK